MGIFDNFWSSDKTSTSSSTYTPNVPQWYKDLQQSNLLDAANVAGRTPDQTVAGFTGDQGTAQDAYRNLMGSNNPLFQAASNTLLNAVQNGANVGPDSYKPYMSPYIDNVINVANRKTTEAADQQKQQIISNANMTNAFGSGRSDLALSRANEALGTQISDNTTKGMQDAFTWANSQALENAKANIGNSVNLASGLTGLATGQTSDTLAQANALNASGTQQQQLDQAYLDSDKNNLTWLNSLTNAANTGIYGGTTTGTQTTPGAGWGSQLLGMGLSAAALASGNPMLMAGGMNGLSSLWNGGASSGTGGVNGQAVNTQPGNMVAANGGLVQNYAGGGLVERMLGDKLDPLTNMKKTPFGAFNQVLKELVIDPAVNIPTGFGGGLVAIANDLAGNKEAAKYHRDQAGEFFKEAFTSKGSREKVPALMQGGGNLLNALYEATTPEDVRKADIAAKEAQRAKELAAQQAAFQAQNASPEQQAAQAPVPQTPVEQVTETEVAPVVEETKIAAEDPTDDSFSDLLKANTPEKSRINLPLLMAGLGMMSSDKPFVQAVGEGGLLGARALGEEQAREQVAAQKLNEILVDLSKNRRQAETDAEKISLQKDRNDTYKEAVGIQKAQQATKTVEAKQMKDMLTDLQKQRGELNKQLTVEMIPANKQALQTQLTDLQSRIDELLRSGNVAAQPQNQVQLPNESDYVDWSK